MCAGAPIKISAPVVSYRETVRAKSSQQCLSKSPNKHNRLYIECEPMDEKLQADIEEGKVTPQPKDAKEQAKYIAEHYGFDPEAVQPKKLWGFGPDGSGEWRQWNPAAGGSGRGSDVSVTLPPIHHHCNSSGALAITTIHSFFLSLSPSSSSSCTSCCVQAPTG